MKTALHSILFCLLTMIAACDADYTPEAKSGMVVEGWIDEGGFPVVILTKNVTLSNQYQKVDSLEQYLIRWAKVTVSDGEKEVILTGKYDPKYFPPYIYTTGNMRGESGKTYTLNIEYYNIHAYAKTTIPARHLIKKLAVTPCNDTGTLFQVKLNIDTENEHNAYYQIFTREGERNRLFIASYLGCINGESLNGNVDIPVYRSHKLASGKKYTPYFYLYDTLAIKLARIDAESYKFWSDYSRNLTLANNLFMAPTQNIHSNIKGATGYWCGMGADIKYIIIKSEGHFYPSPHPSLRYPSVLQQIIGKKVRDEG